MSLRSTVHYLLVGILLLSAQSATAAPPEVPEPLRAWEGWVLGRDIERRCATHAGDRRCEWLTALQIEARRDSIRYLLTVSLDTDRAVQLPGGGQYQTAALLSERGEALVVTRAGDRSEVFLPAGTHTLNGEIRFLARPQTLPIPRGVALLSVTVDGKPVERPRLSEQGDLWLGGGEEDGAERAPARLELQLYRRLVDGVPFRIDSALRLRVSGPPREVSLGQVLLAGTLAHSVSAALPTRLTSSGELTVQLRPGEHVISISSYLPAPPGELRPLERRGDEWPEFEVWSWSPNEGVRSVEWSGGNGTDPARYEVPGEWSDEAAFVVTADDTVTLRQTRRGEELVSQNRLRLRRTLWLDASGGGFTAEDSFSGQMNQEWRLTATPSLELGRVTAQGVPALITGTPEERSVEVRDSAVSVVGLSRIAREPVMDAIGWRHDVDELKLTLNLPPGWRFLEATGVDSSSKSWLDSWSLLRLFFLLLVSVGLAKVGGTKLGMIAAATLIALHDVPGAPFMGWFHVLLAIALHRFLESRPGLLAQESLRSFLRLYARLTMALIAIRVLVVVATELRRAIFPVVDSSVVTLDLLGYLSSLTEGDLFQWPFVVLTIAVGLTFLRALMQLQIWRAVKYFLLLAVLSIFIPGMLSTIQYSVVGSSSYRSDTEFMMHDLAVQGAPAPMAESYMSRSESLRQRGSREYAAKALNQAPQSLQVVDPSAVVQTGPGKPTWSGSSVQLSWSGPVSAGHQVALYLVGPLTWLAITLVRVALLVAMAFLVTGLVRGLRTAVPLLALLLSGVLSLQPAVAQSFPSEELLQELQARLTRYDCKTDCLGLMQATVTGSEERIEMRLTVASRGAGVYSLPGPSSSFLPERVLLGGAPAALRRDERGFIQVRVPDGVHEIQVIGSLRGRDEVGLTWVDPYPAQVRFDLPGWEVIGVLPSGALSGATTLQRVAKRATEKGSRVVDERETAPFYIVRRSLELGVSWQVITEVLRVGGLDASSTLNVPLIPGEVASELGDGVAVRTGSEGGTVAVSFRRGETERRWTSTLAVVPQVPLTASSESDRSEEWSLGCSSLWRCSWGGVVPTSSQEEGQYRVRWLPFPGERLELAIARPQAVAGQEVTIESVNLRYLTGPRVSTTVVSFSLEAFRGGVEAVTLPEGSLVRRVTLSGTDVTSRFSGSTLNISFEPGTTPVEIEFQREELLGFIARPPPIRFTTPPVNVQVSIVPHESRWVFWLGGESWGPRVLFWSALLVLAFVAVVVGKSGKTLLPTRDWLLLGLSVSVLPVTAIVLPVIWQLLLKYRRDSAPAGRGAFNALQIAVSFLTLCMIAWVYFVVQQGLLADPDMGIAGNGSHLRELRWFVDRSDATLPEPYMISAPLWIWRAAMLIWSTWAVFALLRWVRETLSITLDGGFWRSA